jgi:hypothetical protein
MATVTGYTADRMLQIENETVIDGNVAGDNLILIRRDGAEINAGNVRGPQGIEGPVGEVSNATLAATVAALTAPSSVSGLMIQDNAIDATKIAPNAVGESELADNSVTAAKIASNAVGSDEIAANAVTASELASNAVTSAKINAEAVTPTKIQNSDVGGIIDRGIDGVVHYIKVLNWVWIYGSGTTASSSWGTLPTGFRPVDFVNLPAVPAGASTEAGRVIIGPGGTIQTPSLPAVGMWSGVFPLGSPL